jgi:hypothetical protein
MSGTITGVHPDPALDLRRGISPDQDAANRLSFCFRTESRLAELRGGFGVFISRRWIVSLAADDRPRGDTSGPISIAPSPGAERDPPATPIQALFGQATVGNQLDERPGPHDPIDDRFQVRVL